MMRMRRDLTTEYPGPFIIEVLTLVHDLQCASLPKPSRQRAQLRSHHRDPDPSHSLREGSETVADDAIFGAH
jgi:hypothetical protein